MKSISTSMTLFDKIALGSLGFVPLFRLFNDERENFRISSFLSVLGAVYFLWISIQLKHVSLAQTELIVSNYFKTIHVPLSQIERVAESKLVRFGIFMILKEPSAFGDKILFQSKVNISELGNLIERKPNKSLNPTPKGAG